MIVTICGSVRLGREVWDELAEKLTLKGHLVFTVNVWNKYDYLHSKAGNADKARLDQVHREKIRMSDRVYFLRKDGYIGPSTQSEWNHAMRHKIPVEYVDIQSSEQMQKTNGSETDG